MGENFISYRLVNNITSMLRHHLLINLCMYMHAVWVNIFVGVFTSRDPMTYENEMDTQANE